MSARAERRRQKRAEAASPLPAPVTTPSYRRGRMTPSNGPGGVRGAVQRIGSYRDGVGSSAPRQQKGGQ